MKYMIVGAKGALAQYFLKDVRFSNNVAFTHEELDIVEVEEIQKAVSEHKPDVLINCAAISDPFECEEELENAINVNCLGPTLLGRVAREHGCKFVHFSTASIYNNNFMDAYSEAVIPRSKNVYPCSKSMGETGLKMETPNHLIIRVSWVFGLTSKCFISRLPEMISSKQELFVNNEQVSKTTYAKDIVDATFKLLEAGKRGIFHFTNKGETTRYEVAEFVRKHFEKEDLIIHPVTSSYFNERIEQPQRNVLATDKYEAQIGKIRTWQEAYTEYLEEIKEQTIGS